MSKSRAYKAGYTRGFHAASWIDLPEIGQELSKEIDWIGIGVIKTPEDRIEAFTLLATEAARHAVQYDPVSPVVDDERWDDFDAGLTAGINANRRKRFPLREIRRGRV